MWWRFRAFVVGTEDLPVGALVAAGCARPLPPEVQAAYDAPFPDPSYQAGPKAFPDLIPQSADDPATPDNLRAWEALERFDKPFLCAFSDGDPITAGADRAFLERVPGAAGQPHTTVARRRALPAGGRRRGAGRDRRRLAARLRPSRTRPVRV